MDHWKHVSTNNPGIFRRFTAQFKAPFSPTNENMDHSALDSSHGRNRHYVAMDIERNFWGNELFAGFIWNY